MTTASEPASSDSPTKPAERLRLLGQEMGLWTHGFDFARHARQLFGAIELRDLAVLEIGCGKGLFCLWAALHGHVTWLDWSHWRRAPLTRVSAIRRS